MVVLLPKLDVAGNREFWRPVKEFEHMISVYKGGQHDRMLVFVNKSPVWDKGMMLRRIHMGSDRRVLAGLQGPCAEAFYQELPTGGPGET